MSYTQSKFSFYIVLNQAIKLVIPFLTDKTVQALIDETKRRLCKKYHLNNNNNNNNPNKQLNKTKALNNIDFDELSTLYWIDKQSFKPKEIYVVLRPDDILKNILNAYTRHPQTNQKIAGFYWFLTKSPTKMLNIRNLRPNDIRNAPDEIKKKYHRNTPIFYSGFYFHAFIAKKYDEMNNKNKSNLNNIANSRKTINIIRNVKKLKKHGVIPSNSNTLIPNPYSSISSITSPSSCSSSCSSLSSSCSDPITKWSNRHITRVITPAASKELNHLRTNIDPNYSIKIDTQIIINNDNDNKDNDDDDNPSYCGINCSITNNQSSSVNNPNQPLSTYTIQDYDLIPNFLRKYIDPDMLYLYKSFDFKYVLLLAFTCRCLNKNKLSQSHQTVLAQTAKSRHLSEEEFKICVANSIGLDCKHVKETVDLLKKQNDNCYINFSRMIVYDCLIHLASDGYDLDHKRLEIVRIISQFGVTNGLSPIEIACIIQMFETENQLLNVYTHLF